MNTPDFSGKKILFTGFSMTPGSEALASYEFAKKYGATDFTTLYWGDEAYGDMLPAEFKKIKIVDNNKFDPELTAGYDLVFRQNATHPDLVLSPVTTSTNEFFKLCPAQIIAVTGTKGKGTTSTLIAAILQEAGQKVHLLGNIGVNALEALPDISEEDIVVFEISSFQLWDIKYSPHVAVVLMVSEDHQDVHRSMDEYVQAKAQIVRYQTEDDLVVFHPTNVLTAQVVAKARSRQKQYLTESAATVIDDMIQIEAKHILPISEVGLIGKHNLENIAAAITAAWEYTQDISAIATAVRECTGLPHRLELVAEHDGVKYFDDSISTIPSTSIAAAKAFDEPKIMILGGSSKGNVFDEFAKELVKENIKAVVLIGDEAEKIEQCLRAENFTGEIVTGLTKMTDMVHVSADKAESGDIVLLSPGCASFGLFKNYKARGDQFKQAANEL